jgi:hypothetical protein
MVKNLVAATIPISSPAVALTGVAARDMLGSQPKNGDEREQ